MGSGQNAFEYMNPRPVNPKKKPPLFQNQIPHINIYEPRSPGIQCWRQPRHRWEPTLKFGGRGREYALRVRTYDIFISCVCEFFWSCHSGGGFFFGFTGPLFQVLHYEEARAAPQIYVRICTCAPIRTPRRILCNMNKHTCMRTRRTRCEQLWHKSSEVLTKQMWYSTYKTYEIHEIMWNPNWNPLQNKRNPEILLILKNL